MASLTLTLSGNTSTLAANYFPPIELDENSDYVCGLVDFQTFMSIPNVTERNNRFYYSKPGKLNIKAGIYSFTDIFRMFVDSNGVNCIDEKLVGQQLKKELGKRALRTVNTGSTYMYDFMSEFTFKFDYFTCLEVPVGSYEISDITDFLTTRLHENEVKLSLKVNKNTFLCELWCDRHVNFAEMDGFAKNNIGSIFGFEPKLLNSHTTHLAKNPVNVSDLNVIKFECNITSGAYSNDKLVHTLHEFFPIVEKGYKLVEVPRNIIYLPVTVRTITNLIISIVDQNNNLVDFRGETITLRVHIKKL